MQMSVLRVVQLLLVCSSFAFSTQDEGDKCTPVTYPEFVDRSRNLFRFFFSGPGQILVGDYHFGCNGLITKFELFCRANFNGAQTLEFQIWRRNLAVSSAEAYDLVGKHVLPDVKPDENNLISYLVPQDEQIQAQPGDIVGIRVYNAIEPNPFQLQAHLVGLLAEVIAYDLDESEETPSFLNLDEVGTTAIFPRRLPVMRITTEPVPVPCGLESEQCTRVDYPNFVDRSQDLIQLDFSGPGQILVGAYRFACDGFITQFDLFCRGNGSQTAEFQVWRPNSPTNGMTIFSLVGKHVLPNARPNENNLLSYSVPEEEQIRVQPGDIVGLRAYNATEPNPFIIQGHIDLGANAADVVGYNLDENEITPSLLNLNEVGTTAVFPGRLPVMNITTVAASCRECTPADYPSFIDRSGDFIRFFLSGPGQLLVGDYEFGCSGRITKFEFYTRPDFNGAQTFEFHVWRQDTTEEEVTAYNLVGKNTILDAKPGANNILSYVVPEDEQIHVQPGDIVGIRGYNAIEPNPFQLQAHLAGFEAEVLAYNLGESEATPSHLNLNEQGAIPLFPRRLPVMNITVE